MKCYELLERPEAWTQAELGLIEDDKGVIARCAILAIDECYQDQQEYNSTIALLRNHIGGGSIISWNDHPSRTHAEVLAAFKAIDR